MNANPATVPTFLLACAWFTVGTFSYRKWPKASLAVGFLMALPCATALFYYTHLLDHVAWYFELRTIPWIELLFSGIGFLGGVVSGVVNAETRTGRLAVPAVFAGILLVPFIKPILEPLNVAALQDKCKGSVCLQSSGSTCGPASAATLLRGLGISATERELAIESYTYPGGTEAWYLAKAIQRRGAETKFIFNPDTIPSPSIAGVRMGGGHFIAIERATQESVTYVDPLIGESTATPTELRSRYRFTGFFLQLRPNKK